MGQLRSAVRTLAPLSGPAEMLSRLDDFVATVPDAETATLVYAELEPSTGLLRYACAGHPPPLLVSASGEARFVWDGRSTPLGTPSVDGRREASAVLGAGDILLLYTDGVVERRTAGLEDGLERLRETALEHRRDPLNGLVDRLLADLVDERTQEDDVCLICLRAWPSLAGFRYELMASPSELATLRNALRSWLAAHDVDDSDVQQVLLAAGEATANAIEHGFGSDGRGTVRVEGTIDTEGRLTITVQDQGGWLDRPSDPDRGRGAHIMRAMMDEVEILGSRTGTEVRMRRSIRGKIVA
jgi:serine/threonine-protein kinase RsbW